MEATLWRHGCPVRIRKVVTGGYWSQGLSSAYVPRITYWLIRLDGRSDSALSKARADKLANRMALDALRAAVARRQARA